MFQAKFIWENLKGYRAPYIFVLCLSMATQGMFMIAPAITGKIIDMFFESDEAADNLTNHSDILILLCCAMIGFTLLRTLLQFLTKEIYETCSQGVLYRVRNKLFEKIQNKDMKFFNSHSKGDLVTRMTGDLDLIRHSLAWIMMMIVESVALFVFTVIYFFTINWLMTLCILAITPFLFFVTRKFSREVGPRYVKVREKLSRLNNKAQENIAANRVVKAFAREEFEQEDFDKFNKEYCEENTKAAMTWLTYQPFIEILSQSLWVVHMAVGGIFVIWNKSTGGEMGITLAEYSIFSSLLWTIANSMRNVGMLINDIQRFFASVNKIIEVYYEKPDIVNDHNNVERTRISGDIEFENVSLQFEHNKVLNDISFSVKEGETVVIMGPTGSGKTLLMNLVTRFYDATSGSVFVGGKNVKDYELDVLRSNVGMTTQDVLLFSDTIDGNIAYGKSDMPEEDVRKYADKASAHFIEKMPEGFETIIGERGVGLSGGQKQRIALARAMAIKPSILILDDTTSAVDLETELEIQQNLASLDFECTKLIIAQRTSTAKLADKIMIIDKGKILEYGSHEELMAKKGYYYEIYCLQNDVAV